MFLALNSFITKTPISLKKEIDCQSTNRYYTILQGFVNIAPETMLPFFAIMMLMDKDKIDAIKIWLGSDSINIFGTPFSGKDTQGKEIAKLLNAELIGSGDILRKNSSPEEIKDHMGSGLMFPTKEFRDLVLPYLTHTSLNGKPLVLSSIGRWYGEEKDVVKALEQAEHPTKAVIFLRLDEDEIWRRWETSQQLNDRGKRHDDHKESLLARLSEFRDKTIPVIDYYKNKGLIVEIDGNQAPTEVTNEIIEKLYAFSRA
jgi:adenylate kinase